MSAGAAPAAICFDFDGTLARFEGDFEGFLDGLRTGLMLTACDFATFAELLSAELRRSGPVTLASALAATLEALAQRRPEDLDAVVAGALRDYAGQVSLVAHARALLERCAARVPLALLSNGPADMQRAAFEQVGVAPLFSAVLVSGDAGVAARKPDPRIFLLACERLGVPPAAALMVGDDPDADIAGARAAGLRALRVGAGGDVFDLGALARRLGV